MQIRVRRVATAEPEARATAFANECAVANAWSSVAETTG